MLLGSLCHSLIEKTLSLIGRFPPAQEFWIASVESLRAIFNPNLPLLFRQFYDHTHGTFWDSFCKK